MPIVNWPDIDTVRNGELATSTVFNRPTFALTTRSDELKVLAEAVESEVNTARGSYLDLGTRLDTESVQDRTLFASSVNDVVWDATLGQITCSGDITIHFPWAVYNNTIQASQFPITLSSSGKRAYVILTKSAATNILIHGDVSTLPLTTSPESIVLVAERVGDAVYIFGQRWNDGDSKRIGEGFVAGQIYSEKYIVTASEGESFITLPNSGTHYSDGKTLQVYANGVRLNATEHYIEGPTASKITVNTCELFADGVFPCNTEFYFRIDSIVTGGAGGGGGGGTGTLQQVYNNGNTITTVVGSPFTVSGPSSEKIAIFNGDITVTGGIDPTYLQLTPQASCPVNNSIWLDLSHSFQFKDNSGTSTPVLNQTIPIRNLINTMVVTASKGRAVSKNGEGNFTYASNTNEANATVIGILVDDTTASNTGRVQENGRIENGVITSEDFIESTLPSDGSKIFLADADGKFTVSRPVSSGTWSIYIGLWDDGGLSLRLIDYGQV